MIETPSFVIDQEEGIIYIKDKLEDRKRRVPDVVAEDAALDMYFHSFEACYGS
jgi:hypothetical protein